MSRQMNRRDFLRTGLAGVAAAATLGASVHAGGAEEAAKPLPTIKLGTLEVSRFLLGSNPFWGYSHKSKQLDEEMMAFYTDDAILRVCDEAARCGLTTIVSPPDQRWVDLWAKYRSSGGKLSVWVAQCHDAAEKMEAEIDRAVKGSAKAVFIQGHRVEQQFSWNKIDVLRKWLDQIKNAGLPGGFAAHWPNIHLELEKRKFPTDFYFQCCYNLTKPDSLGDWCREADRKAAMETIAQIEKPVVAYKILGAGRLRAADGFEQAFNSIKRKDGVCVGIWAREAIEQIRENATLTEMLTAKKTAG